MKNEQMIFLLLLLLVIIISSVYINKKPIEKFDDTAPDRKCILYYIKDDVYNTNTNTCTTILNDQDPANNPLSPANLTVPTQIDTLINNMNNMDANKIYNNDVTSGDNITNCGYNVKEWRSYSTLNGEKNNKINYGDENIKNAMTGGGAYTSCYFEGNKTNALQSLNSANLSELMKNGKILLQPDTQTIDGKTYSQVMFDQSLQYKDLCPTQNPNKDLKNLNNHIFARIEVDTQTKITTLKYISYNNTERKLNLISNDNALQNIKNLYYITALNGNLVLTTKWNLNPPIDPIEICNFTYDKCNYNNANTPQNGKIINYYKRQTNENGAKILSDINFLTALQLKDINLDNIPASKFTPSIFPIDAYTFIEQNLKTIINDLQTKYKTAENDLNNTTTILNNTNQDLTTATVNYNRNPSSALLEIVKTIRDTTLVNIRNDINIKTTTKNNAKALYNEYYNYFTTINGSFQNLSNTSPLMKFNITNNRLTNIKSSYYNTDYLDGSIKSNIIYIDFGLSVTPNRISDINRVTEDIKIPTPFTPIDLRNTDTKLYLGTTDQINLGSETFKNYNGIENFTQTISKIKTTYKSPLPDIRPLYANYSVMFWINIPNVPNKQNNIFRHGIINQANFEPQLNLVNNTLQFTHLTQNNNNYSFISTNKIPYNTNTLIILTVSTITNSPSSSTINLSINPNGQPPMNETRQTPMGQYLIFTPANIQTPTKLIFNENTGINQLNSLITIQFDSDHFWYNNDPTQGLPFVSQETKNACMSSFSDTTNGCPFSDQTLKEGFISSSSTVHSELMPNLSLGLTQQTINIDGKDIQMMVNNTMEKDNKKHIWICVLNYWHKSGDARNKRIISDGNNFPIWNTNPESVNSSQFITHLNNANGSGSVVDSNAWGHLSESYLRKINQSSVIKAIKFVGATSAHNRKVDFYTTQQEFINYMLGTGTTSQFNYITNVNHNANLPGNVNNSFSAQTDLKMLYDPFYYDVANGGNHWNIDNNGKWEMDDINPLIGGSTLPSTVHQVWIELAVNIISYDTGTNTNKYTVSDKDNYTIILPPPPPPPPKPQLGSSCRIKAPNGMYINVVETGAPCTNRGLTIIDNIGQQFDFVSRTDLYGYSESSRPYLYALSCTYSGFRGLCLRHCGYTVQAMGYSGNNFDYSWYFINYPRDSSTYIIFNYYGWGSPGGAGWYLGLSGTTVQIQYWNGRDSSVVKWLLEY